MRQQTALLSHLRKVAKQDLSIERMRSLNVAASRSVGIREGTALAKLELRLLLTQYELLEDKFEELEARLDELLGQILMWSNYWTLKE